MNFLKKFFLKSAGSRGLTLIEVLVVAGLIVFMASLVIRNFSGSRVNLERVANVMASDIRTAQQLAISSHQYQAKYDNKTPNNPNDDVLQDPEPRNRCGYGITVNPDNSCSGYLIYAGPPTVKIDGSAGNCSASRQYQGNQDATTYKSVVLDTRLNFDDPNESGANAGKCNGNAFNDIFFEPPGPTTYLKNSSIPPPYFTKITIKKVGKKLTGPPSSRCISGGDPDCIYICVYVSGRVEVTRNSTCPAP